MLNVNELTSRMAQMSDAQLRQYAQLHKDDPYTLALAASESKRRAQLRAAGQPQAAQQPTVADQTLAQMGAPVPMPQQQLPEEQGIGMLPAENMSGMADGGIAGYDDGYASGGVVAFAGNEGSVVKDNMTPEQRAELLRYQQENFDRLYGLKDWASGIATDVVDWFKADRSNIPFESKAPAIKYKTPKRTGVLEYERPEEALERERRERGIVALEDESAKYKPEEKPEGWAVKGKKKGEKSTAPAAIDEGNVYTGRDTYAAQTGPFDTSTNAGRNAAANRPGTKSSGTKDAATGQVDTGTEKSAAFTPGSPGDLTAEIAKYKTLMGDIGKDYDTLATETEKGFAKRKKEREESRPKDKAYTGLEALLGKEEEKAKVKEARNLNMALINAGLAIAGGRSQYALQNIAEGAQVGTKQYQEGLEKLEAAALERRKQAAMIEEARRAEARGDWKEAEAFNQQAFEAGLALKRSKIEAISKLTGDTIKVATDRVNTLDTIRSQDQRAIFQQEMENKRHAAEMKNRLSVAGIYSAQRGANQNLPNIVWDNASQAHQRWLSSPEGKLAAMTPGASDAKFQELLRQAAQFQGIQIPSNVPIADPYAGWGNLQVGPGKQ